MPICWPSSSMTRISRARMRSFVRIKRLSIRPSVDYQVGLDKKYSMAGVSGPCGQESPRCILILVKGEILERTGILKSHGHRLWLLSLPLQCAPRLGRATLFNIV